MTGTIVTFYSYKGGVGRTFALANTAVVLAQWGYRVLCIDWDLDAPGLAFYLRPVSYGPVRGLVDLVDRVVDGDAPDPLDHIVPITLPGIEGRLDLLAAGSGDARYVQQAQELDWALLYEYHDFGAVLERWRAAWTAEYDVVLVDSRTGITDIGGICTTQLPDVLVMLFTANEQSLRGTLDIARRAADAHNALPHDRGGLRIVPVLSRFDAREEYERAGEWRQRVVTEVGHLLDSWAYREVPVEKLITQLTIPYVSYWSFGEDLPAVAEQDPDPERIGYSLETLAALLAHRLGRTDLLAESRDSYVAAAARGGLRESATERYDVYISCDSRDFGLAESIVRALRARSLQVFLPSLDVAEGEAWSPSMLKAITNSTTMLVIVGESLQHFQTRDVESFVRQILDEGSGRLVIPVLLPRSSGRAPGILSQFQPERLHDVTPEAVETLSIRVTRAVSASGTVDVGARSEAVHEDAFDTLSDVTAWRLDPLRWQLIDQGLGVLEEALDGHDDDSVRVATADIELLGPVRGSGARGGEVVEIPHALRDRILNLISRLDG